MANKAERLPSTLLKRDLGVGCTSVAPLLPRKSTTRSNFHRGNRASVLVYTVHRLRNTTNRKRANENKCKSMTIVRNPAPRGSIGAAATGHLRISPRCGRAIPFGFPALRFRSLRSRSETDREALGGERLPRAVVAMRLIGCYADVCPSSPHGPPYLWTPCSSSAS